MGTRHLISVYADGVCKVAQYGQFDGYPSAAGETVREFCANQLNNEWEAKVRQCFFFSEEERGARDDWDPIPVPLHRNTGSDILQYIAEQPPGVGLVDRESFAADSLFCEWAWVVDLDARVFEAYEGFNKGPPVGRFKDFPCGSRDEEYLQVTLVGSWSLDDVPTQAHFLKHFQVGDE